VTTLLLARHGETDWNRDGRWQGHADPPLNALGRAQAEDLAGSVASRGVTALYASDLRRSSETARIVGAALGLPVTTDAELREIDVGEWSGLTTPEVARRFPDGLQRHRAGGDGWVEGETHAAMQRRVVAAARRIAAWHDGETVLCVTHGGAIRALLADAEGISLTEFRRTRPALANAELAAIALGNGRARRLD